MSSEKQELPLREFRYQPKLWLDFSLELNHYDYVSACIGPERDLYILSVSSPADYRRKTKGASFPKHLTETNHDFRVLHFDGANLQHYMIRNTRWNFHYVQPLPNSDLLLVSARCSYGKEPEANAHVYSLEGELKSSFVLGDGIADVQTTSSGQIWTSYFDEGVFGNNGWNNPIGAGGLLCWTAEGKKLLDLGDILGHGEIADCYALNVPSNRDTYFYSSQKPLPLVVVGEKG